MMSKLLSRDREGMATVLKAREFAEMQAAKVEAAGAGASGTGSGDRVTRKMVEAKPLSQSQSQGQERKRTRSETSGLTKEVFVECKEVPSAETKKRNTYSLTTLRHIGFDPIAVKSRVGGSVGTGSQPEGRRPENEVTRKVSAEC
jgi:hypothetical protein